MKKGSTKIYTHLFILFIICIFAYYYAVVFAPSIENIRDNNSIWGKLNKIHKSCIMYCPFQTSNYHKLRGSTYFIGDDFTEEEKKMLHGCIITFWNLTHLLMYIPFGYLLPDYFVEVMCLGLFFELYECHKYNCQDMTDLVMNFFGFVIGKTIRTVLQRRKK